jgi:Fur family peroxide stress response transcriptional regulator
MVSSRGLSCDLESFLVRSAVQMRQQRMQLMLDGVRGAGLKLTPQRLAIVRELAGDESHPTAQELYERLRSTLPSMSFATVYNTLDALTAAGLCTALSLSPGSGRFDPNMAPHHHLVCDRCGAVRDLPAPSAGDAGLDATASLRHAVSRAAPGFALRSVERIFRGLCASCCKETNATKTKQTRRRKPTWPSSQAPRRIRT